MDKRFLRWSIFSTRNQDMCDLHYGLCKLLTFIIVPIWIIYYFNWTITSLLVLLCGSFLCIFAIARILAIILTICLIKFSSQEEKDALLFAAVRYDHINNIRVFLWLGANANARKEECDDEHEEYYSVSPLDEAWSDEARALLKQYGAVSRMKNMNI